MNRDLSEEQSAARQRLLLEVNSNIGSDAHHLPIEEWEARRWDFLCECGDPACAELVHLALADYDELRAAEAFVLAESHTLQRAEATRAWARAFWEETIALRAQASIRSYGGRSGTQGG